MTDAEIGELIGAPQATVNRLRNGKHSTTNYARAEAIKQLAIREGIAVDDIIVNAAMRERYQSE